MKRRYRGCLTLSAQLRIDERCFELSFEPNYLAVLEREAMRFDVCVAGSLENFQRWLFLDEAPYALRNAGELAVTGNEQAFRTLTGAFSSRAEQRDRS
jgi:hypothetical protein